jgi:hypothetical protein
MHLTGYATVCWPCVPIPHPPTLTPQPHTRADPDDLLCTRERGWSQTAGIEWSAGCRDGPASAAQFDSPSGVCIDVDGNLLIADTNNNRVRLMTPAGEVRVLRLIGCTRRV